MPLALPVVLAMEDSWRKRTSTGEIPLRKSAGSQPGPPKKGGRLLIEQGQEMKKGRLWRRKGILFGPFWKTGARNRRIGYKPKTLL